MEKTILANLLYNEQYSRKVSMFLNEKYFQDTIDLTVYKLINSFNEKYNTLPSKEALLVDLNNIDSLTEDQFKQTKQTIEELKNDENTDLDWLIDKTEKFCQDKAVYNAIRESIKILDGKTKETKNAIPKLLQDALQVSFDTSIGHDFIDNSDERFRYYHQKLERIPFDLEKFNSITDGGIPDKTFSVIMGGTNTGKTQMLCHMAAANLRSSKNVLYITLEMSEKEIGKRIDANLLDVPMDQLSLLPHSSYQTKMDKFKQHSKGKLIIKEYPTSQAGYAHFVHLLNELKIKKNFIPDIVYIDYINICCSSRVKRTQANSYEYIKAIAEELRGMAVEHALPIVTATQTNRTGFVSSDVGLEDIAESFGLAATADFVVALITTEELETMNQMLVKQLKNRFASKQIYSKFVIGVDRSKMRFYDVESSAHEDLYDVPVMDNTKVGEREEELHYKKPKTKFDKTKFKGFK